MGPETNAEFAAVETRCRLTTREKSEEKAPGDSPGASMTFRESDYITIVVAGSLHGPALLELRARTLTQTSLPVPGRQFARCAGSLLGKSAFPRGEGGVASA